MKTRIFIILPVLISILLTAGCNPGERYRQKLKKELARGVRCDSLFLGLYLGMEQKDFYSQCWKLNKKGLIRQGSTNTTVLYNLEKELKYPATMDFYPKFENLKISEMPVIFAYKGWAPWNKELSSEKLQQDVLRWFRKIYGGDFIKISHPVNGDAYVNVNCNRRISVFRKDDLHVWALFTDMLIAKDRSLKPPSEKNPADTIKIKGN